MTYAMTFWLFFKHLVVNISIKNTLILISLQIKLSIYLPKLIYCTNKLPINYLFIVSMDFHFILLTLSVWDVVNKRVSPHIWIVFNID